MKVDITIRLKYNCYPIIVKKVTIHLSRFNSHFMSVKNLINLITRVVNRKTSFFKYMQQTCNFENVHNIIMSVF